MKNFALIPILLSITLGIQVSGYCDTSCVVIRSTCDPYSQVTKTTLSESKVEGRSLVTTSSLSDATVISSQIWTSTLSDSLIDHSNISFSTLTECRIIRSTVKGMTYRGCIAKDNDFSHCHPHHGPTKWSEIEMRPSVMFWNLADE